MKPLQPALSMGWAFEFFGCRCQRWQNHVQRHLGNVGLVFDYLRMTKNACAAASQNWNKITVIYPDWVLDRILQ
jgi:hypothetical protein